MRILCMNAINHIPYFGTNCFGYSIDNKIVTAVWVDDHNNQKSANGLRKLTGVNML